MTQGDAAPAPMTLGEAVETKKEKKARNIARRLSSSILSRKSSDSSVASAAHAAPAASHAPPLSRGASVDPAVLQAAQVKRATVLWDWAGASESEVSCAANEVVTLLDNPDGSTSADWQYVKTAAGREGYIAKNYLQEIQSGGVSVPASAILGRGRGRGIKPL